MRQYWSHVIHNRDFRDDPHRLEEPRIRYALNKLHGTVLDLACNDSFLRQSLEDRGCSYYGIEANRYVLELKRVPTVVQGDVQQLPFKTDTFDSIFAGEVLEHVPSPEKMLDEAHRVLKVDGDMVLTTPVPKDGFNNPDHFREYAPINLSWLLFRHGYVVLERYVMEVYPGRQTNAVLARVK